MNGGLCYSTCQLGSFPLSINGLICEVRTDAGSWFASQCNTACITLGFFFSPFFDFFLPFFNVTFSPTEFINHTEHFVKILNWTYSQISSEKKRNRLTIEWRFTTRPDYFPGQKRWPRRRYKAGPFHKKDFPLPCSSTSPRDQCRWTQHSPCRMYCCFPGAAGLSTLWEHLT